MRAAIVEAFGPFDGIRVKENLGVQGALAPASLNTSIVSTGRL
jgi:hypothetical protein